MPIPETTLSQWATQPSPQAAKHTHESIRHALSTAYRLSAVTFETYLQGSYRNDTNIRQDSDVDIVVELTSAFAHNVAELSGGVRGQILSSFTPAS